MSMFGMGDAFDYMIMQSDDDANEIITNILKLKNTAKTDENIDISAIKQQIINEQNRLINLISGE